jgi:hypothetical protein
VDVRIGVHVIPRYTPKGGDAHRIFTRLERLP